MREGVGRHTNRKGKEVQDVVKGKLSRSSLGQTMPVHAEPLGFTNASFRAVIR